MNVKFFKVESFSEPHKQYIIRKITDFRDNVEYKCECPQGVFKGKCDHIRKIRHMKLKHHGRKKGKEKSCTS